MRAHSIGLSLVLSLTLCPACASSSGPAGSDDAAPASQPASQPAELEGQPPAEPAAAAEDLCALASYAAWSECVGKRVRVTGRRAEFVQQHPMMSQPEGLSPDGRNTYQGYMDTDDAQLIVLTKAAFDCPAGMSVVGVLERVDLGGPAGTKESYAGWTLSDAEVSCE